MLVASVPEPVLPGLLRRLGAATVAEAFRAYWDKVDAYKDTDAGRALWHQWFRLRAAATGLTFGEYEILEAEYWKAEDAKIDHDALERASRRWYTQALTRDLTCGYCGTKFLTHAALLSHQSFCSFKPVGSIDLELWRNRA